MISADPLSKLRNCQNPEYTAISRANHDQYESGTHSSIKQQSVAKHNSQAVRDFVQ